MADVNYEPPGTVAPFLLGEKFVELIVGPLGSTKTTGGIMKIAYHAAKMAPGKDGIRRSRAVWVRNCYDPETEILTERRGWVRFDDLRPDDAVATRYGDRMGFEVPRLHYAARHTGKMIGIRAEGIDLLVTPDHELWVSSAQGRARNWSDYKHIKAHEIYGRGQMHRMTTVCDWQGDDTGDEDWFEFLGFWFADGTAGVYPRPETGGHHYRVVLAQNPRPDNYVEDLLARNGFKYGTSVKTSGNVNYSLSMVGDQMRDLARTLEGYGKARTKAVPDYVKQGSARLCAAFIRGYQYGDGTFRTYGSKVAARIRTVSPRLADDLQEIAIRAGYHATKAVRDGGDLTRAPMYSITLHDASRDEPIIRKQDWRTVEDYDGMVHCVEVSTHIVLVRRNGKPVWCGQTREQLRDTSIPDVLGWFPEPDFGTYLKSEYKYTLCFGDVQVEILFRGLDDSNDVKRLLSLQVSFGIVEEFREINPAIYEALQGRLGRYPSKRDNGVGCVCDDGTSNAHLWGMSNPPDMDTFWERLLTNPPNNVGVHIQPSGLSAEADWIEFLPEGYYDNLADGKSEDYIDVYIHSKFGKSLAGKQVHRSFNPDFHVAKGPLTPIRSINHPLIIGADWGLNPSVNISQIDPKGRLVTYDALTSDGTGILQFARNTLKPLLAQKYAGHTIIVIGDPAGSQRAQTDEKSCFDIMRAEGFTVRPARTNNIVARISAVDSFLTRQIDGGPAYIVDPGARVLIDALRGGYRYKLKKSGDFEDTPEKNSHSHIADSFQYTCLHAGGDLMGGDIGVKKREIKRVSANGWT